MSFLSLACTFAYHFFLPPFICVLILVLFLASFGKSLGIRKIYVQWLLKVFKFATLVANEAKAQQRKLSSENGGIGNGSHFQIGNDGEGSNSESEDDSESLVVNAKVTENGASNGQLRQRREALKKYGKESRHNVISRRDNLVLSPDQPPKIKEEPEDETQTDHVGMPDKNDLAKMSAATFQREFHMDSVLDYVKTGIASIIEDEVTQRFVAEELKMWNLLTRTSQSFEFVNLKLTMIWVMGFVVRYCVLLPGRMLILFVGLFFMAMGMVFVGHIRDGELKRWLHYQVYTLSFQILGGSLSAVITYHNPENRPKQGICVANHTSPIDVLVLACDNAYALIGQTHSGFLGRMQSILSNASAHIWFDRNESKDRALVAKRLKEHVDDPTKLPILIFPEGTCINNTSVMQFKKGSFEVGGTIYPVAIKYDPIFGDAFWNSSQNGMASYIYLMMTSWAIVCDVWYLPPMTRGEGEDAVDFANRVKAEIARQGGLVDLMWDGNLKRMAVKSEWKAKQQEAFSKSLKV